MTNVTEMTHQELIDGAKGRWGLGKAAVCEAELLRRLGAAVSASPQPRCPKCSSEDLRLIVNSNSLVMDMFCLHGHDFLNIHWPAGFRQFFAAAFVPMCKPHGVPSCKRCSPQKGKP